MTSVPLSPVLVQSFSAVYSFLIFSSSPGWQCFFSLLKSNSQQTVTYSGPDKLPLIICIFKPFEVCYITVFKYLWEILFKDLYCCQYPALLFTWHLKEEPFFSFVFFSLHHIWISAILCQVEQTFFYEILSHFFTVKLNKDVFWYLSAAYFDDPRWWVSLFCFLCCASFCRSWLKKLAAWGTAKPSEFNYKSSLLPAADPSLALWFSFPHCYCLDTSFLDYTGSATTCVFDSYRPCHMLMHVLHYWLADRHIHLNYVL